MKLQNFTLIFDRKLIKDKPVLVAIMMIKNEDVEDYADYWFKEEYKHSEPEDAISSVLDKLLGSTR